MAAQSAHTTIAVSTPIPAEIVDDEISSDDRSRYLSYYEQNFPALQSLLTAGRTARN